MRVVIKEREYEYTSDYPEGWQFSSGDYFKFPVSIGNYPCFVKRFEKKNPSTISGWDLMVKLEHRYEPNLARIYDITSVEERGKRVYYVFYEYLKGNTLNNLIARQVPLNVNRLTDDLFSALSSLHKYQHWFSDFVEKNIFLEDSGRFVLMDLDSAQPLSKLPDNEMYGSKEYWALVFDFYKDVLKYKELKVADLPGLSLNYLQVIFVVLRLKVSFYKEEQQYHYAEHYHELPALLDQIDPAVKEVFIQVYNERSHPEYEQQAATVKRLIVEKIIPYERAGGQPAPEPVIESFAASTGSIEKGGSFELRWKVREVSHVELYKNGVLDGSYGVEQSSVTKKAFYDGGARTLSYKLVAYKGDKKMESTPITIEFKKEPTPIPVVDPVIRAFTASTYTIQKGQDFELRWEVENATRVEIYQNGIFDSEHSAAVRSITKTISLQERDQNVSYKLIASNKDRRAESKTIALQVKDEKSNTGKFIGIAVLSVLVIGLVLWLLNSSGSSNKEVVVSRISPERVNSLQQTITIYGKHFPNDISKIQVLLKGVKGNIISHSDSTLEVGFPKTVDPTYWNGPVKVGIVVNKGDTLYSSQTVFVYRDSVRPQSDSREDTGFTLLVNEEIDSVDRIREEKRIRDSIIRRKEELKLKEEKRKKEEEKRREQKRIKDSITRVTDSITRKKLEDKIKDEKKKSNERNIYNSVSVTPKFRSKERRDRVKDVQITVTNGSDYHLDNVVVEVSYYSDKRGEVKKETLNFSNIKPHSSLTLDAPKGRGSTVTPVIKSIVSKQQK